MFFKFWATVLSNFALTCVYAGGTEIDNDPTFAELLL